MDSPQCAQPVKRVNILVGENLGLGVPKDKYYERDNSYSAQKSFRRDCDAVFKFASPRDPTLSTITSELSSKIAADLEARMSAIAQRSKPRIYSGGPANYDYPPDIRQAINSVDAWTRDILEWATYQNPTAYIDGQRRNGYDTFYLKAYIVTPYYEAFLLFVAHKLKEHTSEYIAAGRIKPDDCRLILPIANEGAENDDDYIHPSRGLGPNEYTHVECGMYPLRSSVEKQKTVVPHLIVADTEIAGDRSSLGSAESHLVTQTKTLYVDQHNRSFAWGLTIAFRWIRAYVFGPDDVWASNKLDISDVEGRQTFISLLVGWSLSSVDRLGFDPTIRYVLNGSAGVPYLEIDVHNVDASTGQVEKHTYYSKRCIGGAERRTGRHDRCFAASSNPESMDTLTFLIKDAWSISGNGPTDDMRENLLLNVLRAEFDKSSEFGGSFSQPVSTGSVYVSRGDTLVADSTDTAFGNLPNSSKVRQHRRTVVQWVGNPISAADDPNQIVIAVADVMIALNEAYTKCKIVHGNINDQAIFIQKTTCGVKGVLGESDHVSYAGDSIVETREHMLFQSIRSLDHPGAARTRLDDWESILYLVCWLGTFGINPAEQMGDSDIVTALRAIPAIDGRHDPLVLRETYENEIVKGLLQVVVKLKDMALVALATSIIANAAEVGSKAAIPPSAAPTSNCKRDDVPYDGPARRTRVSRQEHRNSEWRSGRGFHSDAALNKDVNIDIFEQLPTPYGLVWFGVALDCTEVKNCTTKFDQVSGSPRVRYFGNIQVGRQLALEKLQSAYDGVVLSYGASEDRRLGIPGEDGVDGKWGVVPARQFVAWYNGLPEAQGLAVDLQSFDKVVIMGHGNVALDCARILLTDPSELASTDITAHALETLRGSNVRHVEMVSRRGPLQVAFTTKELREMTKIPTLDFICDCNLVASKCAKCAEWLDVSRLLKRMMDLLTKHSERRSQQAQELYAELSQKPRRGPVDAARAVGTGEFVDVPCGLILRSIGYASTPLDGAPFDGRRKIIPNIAGRATDNGELVPGLYATGWVKRGPVGVIAMTMQDAYRIADSIIMDLAHAQGQPREAIDQMLSESG
ncbi:NADPH-adrenodoxin reductase [Coemansia furcata]|nr:NADPH-adrenodoxin reductase [Coemansia furcata]